MKSFLLIMGVGAFLFMNACKPVSEKDARQAAQERFAKVCWNYNYPPQWFDGPVKTRVGGAAYAYEWKANRPEGVFGILVIVMEGGDTNVSMFGKIPNLPDRAMLPPIPN